ncbi:hypothetical protein ABT160_10430 [Streptomyces sp. NPDC001941]|uniref:hypothetical protein n=1 Tax=Streptomyces sp. NPDC001941 TaxID=3154659 RepID=UPI00332FF326
MAKQAHDPRENDERARNAAAQARAREAIRNIHSVSAKTRGMQQKAQAKRG